MPEPRPRQLRTATIIPNPGLRELHRLLRTLRCADDPAPMALALELRLAWADATLRDGPVAVSTNDSTAAAHGHIVSDGSFVKTQRCSLETIIAVKNLASEPRRRFRRFGQERCRCPFCQEHLGFGELSSVIGYCEDCARCLGWPHGERAAERAEDVLRRDIMRELEQADQQENPETGRDS